MTGKRIGYIRVSTIEQNPDRQLENVPLDKKFIEYASARSTDRPQLQAMLDFIREDDIVFVHSMDRLARNLIDLRGLVTKMVSNKIEVHFFKENLVFGQKENPISMLLLSIMGAFAEFEYAFIRERQREGILIAKRNGRYKGTQKKLNGEKIETLKKELQTNKSKSKIAEDLGISRFTLYKYIEDLNLKALYAQEPLRCQG
jgi:DNA invertase Pin-like site-specific DNA recombinase